jgi:hypothetical protein
LFDGFCAQSRKNKQQQKKGREGKITHAHSDTVKANMINNKKKKKERMGAVRDATLSIWGEGDIKSTSTRDFRSRTHSRNYVAQVAL